MGISRRRLVCSILAILAPAALFFGCAGTDRPPRLLTFASVPHEAGLFRLQLGVDPATLLSDMKTGSADRRERAHQLLVFTGEACASAAKELGREDDWELRAEAAGIIGEAGADSGLETLVELVADPNWSVRRSAVRALGPILARAAAESPRGFTDDAGSESGGRYVGAVSALENALHDEIWAVRQSAVLSLERLSGPRTIVLLVHAAGDQSDDVALAALSALADESTRPLFEEVLDSKWQSKREKALRALRPGIRDSPVSARSGQIQEESTSRAAALLAVRALERIGTRDAARSLERACTAPAGPGGPDWRVRAAAAGAACRLQRKGLSIDPHRLDGVFRDLAARLVSEDLSDRQEARTFVAGCGAAAAPALFDAFKKEPRDQNRILLMESLRDSLQSAAAGDKASRLPGRTEYLDEVLRDFQSLSPRCQELALDWSIEAFGRLESLRTLASATRVASPEVRAKAILALSQLPVPDGTGSGPDPVGDIIGELLLDPATRADALEAVARRPLECYRPALEELYAQSSTTRERIAILNALAATGRAAFPDFLLKAWESERDRFMRSCLLTALAQAAQHAGARKVVLDTLAGTNPESLDLQQHAFEVIERWNMEVPAELLVKLARESPVAEMRANALRRYARRTHPDIGAGLPAFARPFLDDPALPVRAVALRIIAEHGNLAPGKEDALTVAEALDSPVAVLRNSVIESLGLRGDDYGQLMLTEYVEKTDAATDGRTLALLEISKRGPVNAAGQPEPGATDVADRLGRLLDREKEPQMRRVILMTLGLLADSSGRGYAVKAVNDPDPHVRANALLAVAALRAQAGGVVELGPVLDAMRDDAPFVRAAAVSALVRDRQTFYSSCRAGAEHAAGPGELLGTLLQALGDADPTVRSTSARALASFEEPQLAPLVAAAMRRRYTGDDLENAMLRNARDFDSEGLSEVARYEYENVLRTPPENTGADTLAHESLAWLDAERGGIEGLTTAVKHLQSAAVIRERLQNEDPSATETTYSRRMAVIERLWTLIADVMRQRSKERIDILRAEIRVLIRQAGDSAQLLNDIAWYLAENRVSLGAALEAAQKAVAASGENAEALDTLGWVRYHRSEYEAAEHHLRKALDLSPASALTRLHLAAVLASLGRRAEAFGELDAALAADPGLWRDALRIRGFMPVGDDREFMDLIEAK
ncbi:MAG: HEAT repeat domain-containing protein [Planctomycetota bacterium]|nr:HEAT repeat domain-containing protein [Planctomycetota bacterium]